ncbi:hypothetical protein Tco_1133131 [Tanacetum coccineum]|uniref:Uncharacterized protein n=1 Tax=Tanacetum coccineum TaxID=301880 RepID=A0ABQ5JFD4_9ASTR
MHTSKDDYLINSLRFVSAKESSQIYGVVLLECLTSPEMKESHAYKTYLGHATGVVPPKIARKFKKASPSKKDSILVQADEEPVQKGKQVKRSTKKSSTTPAVGIVFRETLVKTKSTGKEKVDVSRGKGIDLLSEVALAEKAQLKQVRKKSFRNFHKTHPSGSGTVAEKPPSVEKITPTGNDEDDSNNEQEASDEGSGQENESEEQEFNSEQDEESDDDNQEEEEVDQENEYQDDEIESNEDKGMDDTTDQFDDDVDARLEEPTQTAKEVVQGEGADVEMIDAQQGNENLETTQEQVVEDDHVTISTVTKKTEVPATSSSRSSDLALKFLNFLDIPHTDAEIISPFDVLVQHEVPRTQAPTLLTIPVSVITESSPVLTNIPQSLQTFNPPPFVSTPTPPPTTEATNPPTTLPDFTSVFRFNDRITTLEKEVAEIKKDPLHTQVTSLVDEHLDTRLGETREEFMNFLSESVTTRIKEQVKDQLPQILPKEVSNFAPPVIKKLIKESRNEVTLAKDKDEDPSAGSDRGLKKRKLSKDAEPTTRPKKKDSTSGSSKGTKSQPKSSGKSVQSDEPVFEVADSDLPQDQKGNLGDNKDEPRNETASRRPTQNWLMTLAALTSTDKSLKDFDELMSTPIDFSGYILNGLKIENLSQEILLGPAFRLLKGIRSNYAELEYNFEECYKALSKKLDWKILKAYLQGGISTMTYTTSTTKTKATKYDLPGIEDMVPNIWSPVKVAYDRYALWGILYWREQCKSFYAYARGMQSRGDVYSTKHILAVSHVKVMRKHRYGYFEKIVLRRADNVLYRFKEGCSPEVWLFRSESRIFNLELKVIKRRSTSPSLILQDQISEKGNRTLHTKTLWDSFMSIVTRGTGEELHTKLYKFSDGTLTRLLSFLEDITKNIEIEYLPKRRWSNLEKKRAHFMIKDINKLLKERRMMRSLEKFVGGRLYGTNLILLQRTI